MNPPHTTTATSHRLPISAEQALRSRTTKRTAGALSDATNLPPKRQRVAETQQTQTQTQTQQALQAAPDWCGNETTSSQATTTISAATRAKAVPAAPPTDTLSLSHPRWALPAAAVAGFAACGIARMYEWQAECLQLEGLLEGGCENLVYSAPTSAGKSLVADVLAVRRVLDSGGERKAVVVVPYVAMVQEKTRFLKKVLEGVLVPAKGGGGGEDGGGTRPLSVVGFHSGARGRPWSELDIAICTIERANTLLNTAIEECTIGTLTSITFDELHLLSEPGRGPVLETLIAKSLCLGAIQIVGMSATMQNAPALAAWLKARCYECAFRPVPLSEFYVVDNGVYTYSGELAARIAAGAEQPRGAVRNAVAALARESVLEGYGVLVFCESRRRCEEAAKMMVRYMPAVDAVVREGRLEVLRTLATTETGLDPGLEKTVAAGVAWHHAGLTTEEKDCIVEAYDKGFLKVICCTATMAAGVNLPARRVIISPRMGRDFISPAMLRQMKGRAGRAGKDTAGESYLVCRPEDMDTVKELIAAKMPSVTSRLGDEESLNRALLEGIATKLATSPDSLDDFIRSTLLFHTTPISTLPASITTSISTLTSTLLITSDATTGTFTATPTGLATVASGFSPSEGLFLHTELSRALDTFNLSSDLHIIYHFTPIHSTHNLPIDWARLRDSIATLDAPSLRAAANIGISPSLVNRLALGGTLPAASPHARPHARFYVALMLRDLLNSRPIHAVAARYNIARGFLQQLSSTCRGFAATSAVFCRRLGWSGLAVLLEHYSCRLERGVGEELVGLARVPWVKGWTARVFWEGGLKGVEAVAKAEVAEVVKLLMAAMPRRGGVGTEKRVWERAEMVVRGARRVWEMECEVVLEE